MTNQELRARIRRARLRYVIGPDGSRVTIADLPPKDTEHWVIRRKAVVVAAVRDGLLSIKEELIVGKFLFWQRSIDRHDLPYQDPRLPRLDNQDQDAATLIDAVRRSLRVHASRGSGAR